MYGKETVGANGKSYSGLENNNDPRETANNYIRWALENDMMPLFYEFADHPFYFKTLYDFSVMDLSAMTPVDQGNGFYGYDPDEPIAYAPQIPVSMDNLLTDKGHEIFFGKAESMMNRENTDRAGLFGLGVQKTDYDSAFGEVDTSAVQSDTMRNTLNTLRTDPQLNNRGVSVDQNGRVRLNNAAGVQNSIRQLRDGTKVAYSDTNLLYGIKPNEAVEDVVASYLSEHVGEYNTIIETGRSVYLDEDLPGEYIKSKYSTHLKKKDSKRYMAKMRFADAVLDSIEIASSRKHERAKHVHNKDAKYGVYRYPTKFAFPVFDQNNNFVRVDAYDANLIILNSGDGKKYLYDVVGIKENPSVALELSEREQRSLQRLADGPQPHGKVSGKIVTQKGQNSNPQNSIRQRDADYMAAVESGDTETAQRMVDEAAKDAGYTVKAYHGTNVKDITVFNTRAAGTKPTTWQLLFGTHFTLNPDYAEAYATKANGSKGTSRTSESRKGKGRVYNSYLKTGKMLDIARPAMFYEGDEGYQLYFDFPENIRKKVERNNYGIIHKATDREVNEYGMRPGISVSSGAIERALQAMSPQSAEQFLLDHGYDSVKIRCGSFPQMAARPLNSK